MVFKRSTALAAATATVLALGAAAPAQAADNDDVARFLFGALATGLLAAAIADSAHSSSSHSVTINRNAHHGQSHGHHRAPRSVHVTPRHAPHAVPAACQRRLNTQHGTRTFVGKPCLEKRGYTTARLPSSCARTLDFGRRAVKAWGVSCLAGKGYRLR